VKESVDSYIRGFPPEIREILQKVRATALQVAPEAQERISYRMPALFQDGVVVYFAAFRNHIGLFPPVQDPELRARVAAYAGPKGNLQFPYGQRIPYRLIAAVVKARLKANQSAREKRKPVRGRQPSAASSTLSSASTGAVSGRTPRQR
jgi:uncharacterized protein YdhG (YjbR/CyaY superfamily)